MVQHTQDMLDIVIDAIGPSSKGLEISPYFDPCLSKGQFDVLYTDYIDNDEIERRASNNPDSTHTLPVPIDFVWQPGAPLASCSPLNLLFDYVLASHVMEHVANPIGWLNELLSVTKVGGKVILFLPCRYFTGDCTRPETTFAQLLESWIRQPSVPTSGQVLDFMTGSMTLQHNDGVQWTPEGLPTVPRASHYSDSDCIETAIFLTENPDCYIDAHCTVWTEQSFRTIISRLSLNDILNVEISRTAAKEAEFIAVLTKLGEPVRRPPARQEKSASPQLCMQMADTITTVQLDVSSQQEDLRRIDHRLSVMHHDLGFLIDKVHHDLGFLIDKVQSDRSLGARLWQKVRRFF